MDEPPITYPPSPLVPDLVSLEPIPTISKDILHQSPATLYVPIFIPDPSQPRKSHRVIKAHFLHVDYITKQYATNVSYPINGYILSS